MTATTDSTEQQNTPLTIEREQGLYVLGLDMFEPPSPRGLKGPPGKFPMLPMIIVCSSIEEIDDHDAMSIGAVLLEQMIWLPDCAKDDDDDDDNDDDCGRKCIDDAINEVIAASDAGTIHGLWIPRDDEEPVERILVAGLSHSGEPDEDGVVRMFCAKLEFERVDKDVATSKPHMMMGVLYATEALTHHHWPEKLPGTIDE